jgi:hypothetical protein
MCIKPVALHFSASGEAMLSARENIQRLIKQSFGSGVKKPNQMCYKLLASCFSWTPNGDALSVVAVVLTTMFVSALWVHTCNCTVITFLSYIQPMMCVRWPCRSFLKSLS